MGSSINCRNWSVKRKEQERLNRTGAGILSGQIGPSSASYKIQDLTPLLVPYWRYGDSIASGFVESTVNEVVSKRMVKKQQMQWTPRGAHLLLQVRTKVLNEELDQTFQRWYPGFRHATDQLPNAA